MSTKLRFGELPRVTGRITRTGERLDSAGSTRSQLDAVRRCTLHARRKRTQRHEHFSVSMCELPIPLKG